MRRVFSYQRARRHKDRIPKGGSPGQSIVRIRQTRSKIKRKKKWQSCFLSPLRTRISNSTRRRYRGIVYIIICCQRRHMHMKVLLKTNIGKHDVCLTVKWLFVRKLYTCLTAYILCTFCWYEANEIWSGIDYFLSLCRSYHVYIYIYICITWCSIRKPFKIRLDCYAAVVRDKYRCRLTIECRCPDRSDPLP